MRQRLLRLAVWSLSLGAMVASSYVSSLRAEEPFDYFQKFLERHRAEGLQRRHADYAGQ